jgi:hypothetical protein
VLGWQNGVSVHTGDVRHKSTAAENTPQKKKKEAPPSPKTAETPNQRQEDSSAAQVGLLQLHKFMVFLMYLFGQPNIIQNHMYGAVDIFVLDI